MARSWGRIAGWEKIRAAMGHTLRLAEAMNLAANTPQGELASTKYCFANAGVEYLVYQPKPGEGFSVELKAGTYWHEWFNPRTGGDRWNRSGRIPGGTQRFKAPFESDATLWLKRASVPACRSSDSGCLSRMFEETCAFAHLLLLGDRDQVLIERVIKGDI